MLFSFYKSVTSVVPLQLNKNKSFYNLYVGQFLRKQKILQNLKNCLVKFHPNYTDPLINTL